MKKVLAIRSLHERCDDYAYWQGRTPQERLDAIEILRGQYLRMRYVEPGLQRICRLVERAPR